MPVIKIFCPQAPAPAQAQQLGQTLHALCRELMHAQPDAIQVLLVPGTLMLGGQPLLVEAHYRDRPDRQGAVLTQFLQALDAAVQQAFGQAPRIRSFAIDQATLGAVR
ncbi:MAG: hypothetical protein RIQ38_1214 [Pseudomonadota bacterium]|jgi:phenylpyruvate tautomerase PptA (4-oxalocrotonate tautomerase family)